MKKLLTLAALVGMATVSFAQGTYNWGNSGTTLVSAGGVSTPVVATSQFYFAVFFAPSGTVTAAGTLAPAFDSPLFQNAAGYNTNTTAAGRITSQTGKIEATGNLGAGTTVDFVIRGWSANAGTSWAAALAFWNNGQPSANMYIGQTVIGNDFVLGGGSIPNSGLVGAGTTQVGGFNMALVQAAPEPTSMALAGLGAAAMLIFRRRK